MPGRPPLREGFTTGSGAAAAAFAAVNRLLSPNSALASVQTALPPFQTVNGQLCPQNETRLCIPVHSTQFRAQPPLAGARVIKDGGDDPDATDGLILEVWAATSARHLAGLPGLADVGHDYPIAGSALQLDGGVFLSTGRGVGRVTLPGLPVAPGEPAVNPEPRRQIAFAAREAALAAGHDGPIHLFLRVPEGEAAAAKTLNARLGILGGISILGTRGTVRPYSHEAWQATISQGLDIARALGLASAAFSTGRNSEAALQRLFPELPPQSFIQAADYAGFSIASAGERDFRHLIWGCYPGKLLKLARGLEYTHARSGPPDLPWLAELARQAGADAAAETLAGPSSGTTVRGAFELLEKTEPALALNILKLVAKMALHTLRGWTAQAARPYRAGGPNTPPPRITLCLFHNNHSLWLRTDTYG
ncbi:MAG: cobalt-precorrin-5B (C(1))-methyltransferase CbiD [Deltaproteobacteria bacterium]|nr:cobalt-precorrin-5B (C(1))-methyltransferase CbiD [Deltaproteobacteria bacterium]